MCLSPPVVELEDSKDLPFLKYHAPEWEWQIFGASVLHKVFVGNLILDNFWLKHFSI